MTPLIQKLVPLTRNAEQFHWFDIGEMSPDLTVIDGSDPIASRLAFPQCAFAYTEDGDPGVLLMTQHNETSIHVTGLARHRGQWFEVTPLTVIYDQAAGYSGEGKGVTYGARSLGVQSGVESADAAGVLMGCLLLFDVLAQDVDWRTAAA